MQTLKKILCLTSLVLLYLEGLPQSSPWKVMATGSNHTIFIKAAVNPSIEEDVLLPGDVIGVFYDSSGTLACGGYTVWTNQNSFITAYGDDGVNRGFTQNEIFKYKVWRKSSNCIVDKVEVTYTPSVIAGANTNSYAENGISEISSLTGKKNVNSDDFYVQVTNATCRAGGKILIESFGEQPYADIEYNLTNILSGSSIITRANEITQLETGEYFLTFIRNNCSAEWPDILAVSQDPNCTFPVISPNKDGLAEDYYIPYQGTAKIYDRSGTLIMQLPIPAAWNATDISGSPLPMGTYIIICEGEKEIMVTVVR